MQLVAYGAQDIYLTGNPQITFFKVVYRRHTNFSMECIRQTFNGQVSADASVTATISRNGDLVYKLYVTSDSSTLITDGSAIVADAELEIGGQRIDRHYQEWNEIWNELTTTESKAIGLKSMVGCVGTSGTAATSLGGVGKIQVPLHFWFCRNPGLALPLIALQYHEVKVKILLGPTGTGSDNNVELWADYIYLDTDERRRFAQVSHEYLIEQVQRQNLTNSSTNRLNFNHPVKELIWTSNANYTEAHIKLNGHDRFALQGPEYFQLRQPFDYHTAVPGQNLPSGSGSGRLGEGGITDIKTIATPLTGTGITISGAAVGAMVSGGLTYGRTTTTVAVGADGALAADAGFEALDNTGTDTGDVVTYFVTTTDLNLVGSSPLSVGDTVLISLSGSGTSHTLATSESVVTTVRSITPGSHTNIAGTNTALQFTTNLTDNTAADGQLVIQSIQKIGNSRCRTSQMTDAINVYSFALKPEEHQPSGTCNFSRIDNAQLVCSGTTSGLQMMYAVNYNVLRIMSGMGGLAYSN